METVLDIKVSNIAPLFCRKNQYYTGYYLRDPKQLLFT